MDNYYTLLAETMNAANEEIKRLRGENKELKAELEQTKQKLLAKTQECQELSLYVDYIIEG